MTCKQGPHVRTRPQSCKTNQKKTRHRHKPNFRETHSGQKSGAQLHPISESTRVFQNLQTPFGGVDMAQAGLGHHGISSIDILITSVDIYIYIYIFDMFEIEYIAVVHNWSIATEVERRLIFYIFDLRCPSGR